MAVMTFTLERVRIDAAGYDDTGYYWGTGSPLWRAEREDWEYPWFFRAANRADAQETVEWRYPGAVFAAA